MHKRIIRTLVMATAIGVGALGFTSCQTYPSGCVRFSEGELPDSYVWNSPSRSVYYLHGYPIEETFVGIAGEDPRDSYAFTWHGPSQYTGWAEYASAMNCYQSAGAYAGE